MLRALCRSRAAAVGGPWQGLSAAGGRGGRGRLAPLFCGVDRHPPAATQGKGAPLRMLCLSCM